MPYLFSRRARLAPSNLVDSMTWAVNVTEKVNAISELDVTLWRTVFSPGLGTLSWTAVVTDLAQLEASEAKLMADSGYLALAEEGGKYGTGEQLDDGLVNFVHADPDASGTEEYASVVVGLLAPGQFAHGLEIGVQIAQLVKKITGRPTSFGIAETGDYGQVGWFSLFDSIGQLQSAGQALAGSAEFTELLDGAAANAYQAGATTQTVFRRMA
jgi:hypothetical protein